MKVARHKDCGGLVFGLRTTTQNYGIVGIDADGCPEFDEEGADSYDVEDTSWCDDCNEEVRYIDIEMKDEDAG